MSGGWVRTARATVAGMEIRDRLWLWGMQVNALAEAGYALPPSTMTTEQAILKTGITNVLMAGGLPLNRETLDAMPSARRIICKWAIHREDERGRVVLAADRALAALRDAKELARQDPRIEAYLIDDFSSVSVTVGVRPEHLARMQYLNAVEPPQLPFMGTIYTMTLDKPELAGLLPHFAGYLTPLWHAADIDGLPADVRRRARLTGGKPQLLCIYLYDFGNKELIGYELMRRQLDVAEALLREEAVYGVVILGTCMMDLDWDSNACLADWLREKGDRPI